MNDTLRQMLPVVVSILVILAVAVLRQYSRTLAAITATMPLNIPLSMWIIYAAEQENSAALADYTASLIWGLVPTIVFMFVAWLTLRAGWTLLPTLVASYAAWALILGMMLAIRWLLGSR
jgi:hypothetical protein